jgi:hypothetical protein
MRAGHPVVQCLFEFSLPDEGTNWSVNHLMKNLEFMHKLVLEESGRVFYSVGVAPNRARHFSTEHPGYFTP